MERLSVICALFVSALVCAAAWEQIEAASPSQRHLRTDSEVWIAIRSDGRAGSGKLKDPYDGSTQAKFDALMTAIPPNNAIHLGPGTFVTQGIVPKSGWRLYLAQKTTLRLDVIASIPGQKWAIFGAGSHDSVSNVRIEGGVWDCNLQNQKIPLAAQAISFISGEGDVTIKNIKVINWGSTLPGAECFVVSVFNVGSTGRIARDVILDGIEITGPAPLVHLGSASLIGANGQDPSNPKALSAGWIENVDITNCYIHDIDIPVMTASIQMGGWCHRVHIHHNRFENLGPKNNTLCGCYLDTGASEDLLVEKNIFSGVAHGIWANLTTIDPVAKWTIRENRILINRSYSSGGIELHGFNTTIRDVVVEKNTISSSTGKPLTTNGIVFGKVAGAIVRDNTIDDINGSNHIVLENEVTDCQLTQNRRRNRALIQARCQPAPSLTPHSN